MLWDLVLKLLKTETIASDGVKMLPKVCRKM